MKKILLLLCAFPFFAKAQRAQPFTQVSNAISFNPFALIEIDYTALVGYENKLAPKIFLSTEAGYIFSSGYIGSRNGSSSNGTGFLIRPSVKWFVAENNRFYLQPQIFYKQVTHKVYDWLGKDVVNGVPAYEQLQDFKYRRKIIGFNAVSGFVLPLDHRRKGFIDLYFGIGVRYKKKIVLWVSRKALIAVFPIFLLALMKVYSRVFPWAYDLSMPCIDGIRYVQISLPLQMQRRQP